MSSTRGARYVQLRFPWPAAIGMPTQHAARFLAAIVNQTLRHQLPAGRRFGRLRALAGRRGVPERTLTGLIALLPRRARGDRDQLLHRTVAGWQVLADRSSRLPPDPPP